MTQEEKQEIINVIIEFLEENGSQVGGQKVRDLTLAEMTDENLSALIIPSEVPSTGEWVQTTLKTMMRPITNNISDLTTLKSQTTAAMDAANSAATLANTKAGVAQTAATNADNKANYANTEADRAKNLNDHPAYIGNDDYWYFWNYDTQVYVKGEYARGDAATIAVGSVETLEPDQRATVSNSGTQGAAVFNFGIPKGVKGDDGEKGDKGDDLDYSTMTQEEKEELSSIIVQKVVEDNILSPYYDNLRECVVIPLSMKAEYDAERGCTVFG